MREAFARLYRKLGELGHGRARGGAGRSRLGDCETGYVLAALADETILQRLDGPGRDAWAPMLLEDALYGTRVAGERVFELARAAADGRLTGRPDLAVTLLLALLAGFRGRFRDADDGGEIRALCVRLFERVHERPWLRDVPWRPALVPPDEPRAPRAGAAAAAGAAALARCAGGASCRLCRWPRTWSGARRARRADARRRDRRAPSGRRVGSPWMTAEASRRSCPGWRSLRRSRSRP